MKFLWKKSALNTLIWLIWFTRFRKTTMCILAYQSSQDGWIEAKEYNFAQDLLPLWVASIKILKLRIWFDEAFAFKQLPPIAWKILLLRWFLHSFFDCVLWWLLIPLKLWSLTMEDFENSYCFVALDFCDILFMLPPST